MSNKKLIWIVDDNRDVHEIIRMTMGNDYEYRTFSKAEDAVKKLNELKNVKSLLPSLIITDYDTKSAMNGLAVVEKAREMGIPAIMQSANMDTDIDIDIKIQAMSAGAKGFLAKPVNIEELQAMVKEFISKPGRSEPSRGDRAI